MDIAYSTANDFLVYNDMISYYCSAKKTNQVSRKYSLITQFCVDHSPNLSVVTKLLKTLKNLF